MPLEDECKFFFFCFFLSLNDFGLPCVMVFVIVASFKSFVVSSNNNHDYQCKIIARSPTCTCKLVPQLQLKWYFKSLIDAMCFPFVKS
jgi:hypothetical protein